MSEFHGAFKLEDENGEPVALVPPESFTLLHPGRDKAVVENEQIESFLRAYAPSVGLTFEDFEVAPLPQDEPDYRVTVNGTHCGIDGKPWDIELTALTSEGLRSQRPPFDHLARLIHDRVTSAPDLGALVEGRTLLVADAAQVETFATGEDAEILSSRIVAALRGISPNQLPHEPAERIRIVTVGGLTVSLTGLTGRPGTDLRVVCSATDVSLTEARAALRACIAAKDRRHREVVVICSADPGTAGSVVPLDRAYHHLLRDHDMGDSISTSHVRQAWLHEIGSAEIWPIPIDWAAPSPKPRTLP